MQLLKIAPLFKIFLLSLTLTLIGCGGSSSSGGGGGGGTADDTTTFSGNTAPAEIDAGNAQAIGQAAGESVERASASSTLPSAPIAFQASGPIDVSALTDLMLETAEQLAVPSGIEVEGVCSSGTASSTVEPPNRTVLTFNNCLLIDASATINGSAVIEFDDAFTNEDSGFTITYSNFSVTESGSGTTQTINMVVVCSGIGVCTFNSDFVGSDGVTHRVSDFSITGDGTGISPYNGSATFFHGTHGSVTITVDNVTYGGGCGPLPDGGTITFTGGNSTSGTIFFAGDCTVSGTFNNGSGAVSF